MNLSARNKVIKFCKSLIRTLLRTELVLSLSERQIEAVWDTLTEQKKISFTKTQKALDEFYIASLFKDLGFSYCVYDNLELLVLISKFLIVRDSALTTVESLDFKENLDRISKPSDLIKLAAVMVRFGRFRLGLQLRMKAAQKIASRVVLTDIGISAIPKHLAARLEQPTSRALLPAIKIYGLVQCATAAEMLSYLRLFNDGLHFEKGYRRLHNFYITDQNSYNSFGDFIFDKRVLIMMPGKLEDERLTFNASDFDLIVRTNHYRFSDDLETKLERCEINYFNHNRINSLANHSRKLVLSSATRILVAKDATACEKLKSYLKQGRILIDGNPQSSPIVRHAFNVDVVLLWGGFLALPRILIDILTNSYPAKIEVWGADMLLTPERKIGYHSNESGIDYKEWYAETLVKNLSAHHEPFAQFVTLKNLMNAGGFKPSPALRAVLNSPIESYAESLERVYRPLLGFEC